jgi:SAM-dependent methyltransferase
MDPIADFREKLHASLEGDSFAKLTLSKPDGAADDLRSVHLRRVEIRGQPCLSLTLRYPDRDRVSNHPITEAEQKVGEWLGRPFLRADLFTLTENDSLLFSRKRNPKLLVRSATHRRKPSARHDEPKTRLLRPEGRLYLRALGLAGPDGELLRSGERKFGQINRYVEYLDELLRRHPIPEDARVLDMGAGRGALTFALYDLLTSVRGMKPIVTGVELRPELVREANELARRCGYKGLSFQAGDIATCPVERVDLLIALHACDTATDLALARGVRAGAGILVVAPCCHKQVRKSMICQNDLQSILEHGILAERMAELLTDGLRALVLEANGYRTRVFDFAGLEHTQRNVLIAAVRGAPRPGVAERIRGLKKMFGLGETELERRLAEVRG